MNRDVSEYQSVDRIQAPDDEPLMMRCLEKGLWASRWAIILGVFANIVGAILMVLVACYDFIHLLDVVLQVIIGASQLSEVRSEITLVLIEIVDGFLMSGVLFIFAFGLYELFISKLTVASNFEVHGKILNVKSIDHLKAKLGNLILMILVVKFFYFTTGLEVKNIQDVALYAGAVCLIGLALFLSQFKCADKKGDD